MHALPPWPVARVRVRRWRGAGTAAAAVRRETIEKLVAQPPRIPPPPPPPLCRRLGGLLARTRERERGEADSSTYPLSYIGIFALVDCTGCSVSMLESSHLGVGIRRG